MCSLMGLKGIETYGSENEAFEAVYDVRQPFVATATGFNIDLAAKDIVLKIFYQYRFKKCRKSKKKWSLEGFEERKSSERERRGEFGTVADITKIIDFLLGFCLGLPHFLFLFYFYFTGNTDKPLFFYSFIFFTLTDLIETLSRYKPFYCGLNFNLILVYMGYHSS